MHLSGRNVLVTGGCGFIGAHVVRTLRAAGAHVTVADLEPFPDRDVANVVGDLQRPEVREAAVSGELDGIIHLAAITSVLKSMDDPLPVSHNNVAVTQELLELARRRGIGRFLMASTNAVVGDVGETPISEDAPLRPLTPYGASKAAAEMLLAGYAGSYGMAACALRFTNVYGPGMHRKDSFVPRLMRAATSDGEVRVYGDGSQRRDLVHVDDAVRGLLVAWEQRHAGPLVLGSGNSVSVLELVDAVRRVTDRRLPAEHVPAQSGEMPAVIVDITRASELGYLPDVALEDGLATVWKDFHPTDGAADAASGVILP